MQGGPGYYAAVKKNGEIFNGLTWKDVPATLLREQKQLAEHLVYSILPVVLNVGRKHMYK